MRHLNHLACDLVGTGVRCALRQFGAREKIELVLSWNESPRHFVEQQYSRGQQSHINGEYDPTMAQCAFYCSVISLRATVKKAVERMEQPPEEAFDTTRQHIFGRIVPSE